MHVGLGTHPYNQMWAKIHARFGYCALSWILVVSGMIQGQRLAHRPVVAREFNSFLFSIAFFWIGYSKSEITRIFLVYSRR